jgi:hypothetical protein
MTMASINVLLGIISILFALAVALGAVAYAVEGIRRQGALHRWNLALAFALCAITLSGCQHSGQSSLPTGWGWYTDTVYPFSLPVPDGWQANGHWDEVAPGDHCSRAADLIPPTQQQRYHSATSFGTKRLYEYIKLQVYTTCVAPVPTITPGVRSAGKTTLGSWSADLYTLTADHPGGQGYLRLVAASIGGHEYRLLFVNLWNSLQDSWQQFQQRDAHDLAIFATVRENFTYHG